MAEGKGSGLAPTYPPGLGLLTHLGTPRSTLALQEAPAGGSQGIVPVGVKDGSSTGHVHLVKVEGPVPRKMCIRSRSVYPNFRGGAQKFCF